MILPTIALVGRPNVGKSTLFNRITRSRDALVADRPGLTRDRHYGIGRMGDKSYLVVDTGGFEPSPDGGSIESEMAEQTLLAIDEADIVLFLVDGREGLTAHDESIAILLRRLTGQRDCRVYVVVNKAEGLAHDIVVADFFKFGLGEAFTVSSSHGDGVMAMIETITVDFPKIPPKDTDAPHEKKPKVAVIGRPNAGKSTLINAFLGENRMIAYDQPGTTRDSIYVDFTKGKQAYTLIDTAGVRRRGKVTDAIEKFSVIKALQAIEDANVVILVLDAQQEVADQDVSLAKFALEAGRALVIAINKCDDIDDYQLSVMKRTLEFKLSFLDFAKRHFISALKKRGVNAILKSINEAYDAAFSKLSTPKLTRALIAAVAKQLPPRYGIHRPKLRYAHQGGMNPPLIVVHGTGLDHVPESYRRYLEGMFMDRFKLQGTPLRVQFKTAYNPYIEKRKRSRK